MSADLFAAFNDPPDSNQGQSQSNSSSQHAPSADPFGFLTSSQSTFTPQQHSSQSSPWPSLSATQLPQHQPSTTDIWGDLNGGGGFSNTTSSPQPSWGIHDNSKESGNMQKVDDEDDGWGDFEVASPVFSNPGSTTTTHAPVQTTLHAEPPTRTRVVRTSTIDLMTNKLVDFGAEVHKPAPVAQPEQQRLSQDVPVNRAVQAAKTPRDSSVLFDADDYDGVAPPEDDYDDDDFGDFETVPATKPHSTSAPFDIMSGGSTTTLTRSQPPPSQLLSTLSLIDDNSPYPQAPKSPSYQQRTPFPGLGITTPVASDFPATVKADSPSPVTAWPTIDGQHNEENAFEKDWGTFDDLPTEPPHKPSVPGIHLPKAASAAKKPAQPVRAASNDWDWDAWEGTEMSKPEQSKPEPSISVEAPLPERESSGPPPTNVPPPSILLALFPQLLSLANDSLFKPLASQPSSAKEQILRDPATVQFLRGYLALATVAARVIAGRKLRWHRDKFLSQAMTISAAGGKGGMKLSGIDKTQARNEDREAAEVVTAWKDQVGRLRSAVATVNSHAPSAGEAQLKLPELIETGGIQTLKGAVTAAKPCIVCGLKRDERVPRADFDVEDSFGEWWVEHWGHRTCRNFWLEHESKLRQR